MFQSRWGFHPCDYQTFRKLKFLNQSYLHAIRLAHAWLRWKRKDPHNRVMRRRIRNDKGQTIGYESPAPRNSARCSRGASPRFGMWTRRGTCSEKASWKNPWSRMISGFLLITPDRDLIACQLPLVQVLSLAAPVVSRRAEPGQRLMLLRDVFRQVAAATPDKRRDAP